MSRTIDPEQQQLLLPDNYSGTICLEQFVWNNLFGTIFLLPASILLEQGMHKAQTSSGYPSRLWENYGP
eukprot:scaffold2902_cov120-Skeletonema_menzelii.AAC.5